MMKETIIDVIGDANKPRALLRLEGVRHTSESFTVYLFFNQTNTLEPSWLQDKEKIVGRIHQYGHGEAVHQKVHPIGSDQQLGHLPTYATLVDVTSWFKTNDQVPSPLKMSWVVADAEQFILSPDLFQFDKAWIEWEA